MRSGSEHLIDFLIFFSYLDNLNDNDNEMKNDFKGNEISFISEINL